MIKSFFGFFLILVMLSSNFSRFFIYAGFEINKDYIASELCVNKDKPTMHCNGKCYLMKKLKQAEEKEKNQSQAAQKVHFQEALISYRSNFNFLPVFIKVISSAEPVFELPTRSAAVFHPPQV